MNKKYNVLVVDDDPVILNMLRLKFYKHKNINIINTLNCSIEALSYINKNNLDLVITDMVMPNYDGLDMLEYIYNKKIKVKVIILTSFCSPNVINKAVNLGVDYVLAKPCPLIKLEETIYNSFCITKASDKTLDEILMMLGIPSHLKGYEYLKTSIVLFNTRHDLEDIYKIISKQEKTLYKNIESAIRYAIDVGYKRASIEKLSKVFGYTIDVDKSNISNFHFIKSVCNYYNNN